MSKRKRKRKKTALGKVRNWLAVWAHFRKAGVIKDKQKEKARKKCRGKVRRNDDE